MQNDEGLREDLNEESKETGRASIQLQMRESESISKQLEHLNTEREDTELFPQGSPASSHDTIVQDLEDFLQDTISPEVPLKCIRKRTKSKIRIPKDLLQP